MSIANFKTMSNFPLFVRDFVSETNYCSVCGNYESEDSVCPICGAEMEKKAFLDEIEAHEVMDEIAERMKEVNVGLQFHSVRVEDGHYYGVQFVVDETDDPNDCDNDECHYLFDACRSVSIRRYNGEIGKINRMLRHMAKEFGFAEVYCSAVFSNGEALYRPVGRDRRSRIMRAATEIR